MELILAVLGAGPLGYFKGDRSLKIYLVLWAIVIPIQTIVVKHESGLDVLYYVFNALILAGGIGLNRFGARLRERRQSRDAQLVSTEAAA